MGAHSVLSRGIEGRGPAGRWLRTRRPLPWELYQILRQNNPEVADLRARLDRAHPGILDEFRQIYEHWDPYWTERIGGPQTEFTTQRVIDFFLASGSAAEVNEQLDALRPLGVRGVSSVLFSIQTIPR